MKYLILITAVGFFLRLSNISPFKFYPDAYQNFIVARNLRDYGSVVGYMGKGGMLYPDFFMWTRPVLPLLISAGTSVTHNEELSARMITFFAGILTIPMCYLFISTLLNDKTTGLYAALLLALSYNHVVWGGFILTETLGVLMMLLLLWSIVRRGERKGSFLEIGDLASGVILSLAVFARYEYIIIIVPISIYILFRASRGYARLFTIALGFSLASVIFLTQLYPHRSIFGIVFRQMNSLITLAECVFGIGVIAIVTHALMVKYKVKLPVLPYFRILTAAVWIGTIWILVSGSPSGIAKFLNGDFLILETFLLGSMTLFNNKKFRPEALFGIGTILILYPFYYRINPTMQRYGTHLLPFILIFSSVGLSRIVQFGKRNKLIGAIVILLLFSQFAKTFGGIKNLDKGIWFRTSYEEKGAILLKQKVQEKNSILLASYPEPYYFFTNLPTQSVADTYPYIYIDSKYDGQEIIIIQDMGMHDLFPNFNKEIELRLQDKKIEEYFLHEPYHYANRTLAEKYPVRLYRLTVKVLRERLNHH